MSLTHLKSPAAAGRWLLEWADGGTLCTDSRAVQAGDAFIAWPGASTDGRRYVQAALAAGAATVLVEKSGIEAFGFDDARIATLPALKAATGWIADAFFDHPSADMPLIAATGTNGKTSTTWWTAQALTALGQRCGVVGTLGIGEPPPIGSASGVPDTPARISYTGLTTPDPVRLHAELARMVREGYGACAMEASSIGIAEERMAGTSVRVALLTNFTQDHLDYHGDMASYWAAKRRLFDWPGLQSACINVDDAQCAKLASELAARPQSGLDVWGVSVGGAARLRASNVHYAQGGLAFTVHEGEAAHAVRTSLIGAYNVSNWLVVLGGLRALDVPLADAVRVLQGVTPVPGRMQVVSGNADAPLALVDFAHTPDALDKALEALRPLAAARGGALWVVFGAGGDRDPGKRPLMGAAAAARADQVLITSDNPRSEAPQAIAIAIAAACPGARVVLDRAEAIALALREAAPADVVLITGKGHETYQEVNGVRHPFDDVAQARAALAARAGTKGSL